ncbi:o-succinylbenzoate synthase [Geodia barretti]|uniref:o-succinylbenzoate synthase n=1 Tax=Geodia barretti TaxID=519541 RepID=A0AA35S4Z6_GEOBA|nr:o-succinylbenzoate synthase [Geodia barretti]
MKIEQLTIRELRLDLKYPFETSFARVTAQQFLLLEARVDGVSGHSECVADSEPGYSYETVRTADHVIRDFLWPLAAASDYAHPDEVAPSFARVRGHNMAKAAIEMAVWDAFARLKGKPLAGVLGGTRSRTVSGVSIGIQDTVEQLIEKIGLELSRGYRRIKIKIKPGWDLEVVKRVRERYPDIPLMVDANSAYTLEDEPLFRDLDRFGLMMIEQPLAHDDIRDHAILQRKISTPICLDESVHSVADARLAIEMGACRIINIKAGRVGGLSSARDIAALAESHGMPVWCGGMLESGVGRAHNIHLSSLSGFSMPGDVAASERYFTEEIIEPPVTVDPDGSLPIPEGEGIGFALREDVIRRHTLCETTLSH